MSNSSPELPAPNSGSPSQDLPPGQRPKRRKRYSGTHPRTFEERYKERDPQRFPETVRKVLESGKTPAGMHRPVMLEEVLEALKLEPGQIGVDCTLGYGGHAAEVLKRIRPGGRLIALDADPVELPRTEQRLRALLDPGEDLVVRHSNFAGLPKVLTTEGVEGVDFIVADLGVSSMQLDDPARGFSYKQEGPLDLRMNPNKGQPASALLSRLDASTLETLLRDYSDEPRAGLIASAIVRAAAQRPILTTRALSAVITTALRSGSLRLGDDEIKSTLARVFQALRIEVNDEFSALDTLLRHIPKCLKEDGRVAILTFHSGEDRRVKRAFEEGWKTGVFSEISEEVIRPGPDERRDNPRSSCAKLRWAVRSPRPRPIGPAELPAADPLDHPLLHFRTSGIHGTGAFARVAIPSGVRVIEYLGERIDKEESLRRCMKNNPFIFTLDDDSDLDGDMPWNPARFLNHSCEPNCESINEESQIWIVSIKDIQPGEEVTFNYGFDYESYREYPCLCGKPSCVGYIVAEEFHEQMRRQKALTQEGSTPGPAQ